MTIMRANAVLGREDELRQLESAVAAAATGTPSLVLVGGEAGIGKTTLVSEAARRTGKPLLWARAMHVGNEPMPLAPVVDLLRQIGARALLSHRPNRRSQTWSQWSDEEGGRESPPEASTCWRRRSPCSTRSGARRRRSSFSRTCTGPTP